MANSFVALPCPAANGSGAAVDASGLGGLKTITVKIPTQGGVPSAQVLIEYSNDDASAIWSPLVQFTKPGVQTVSVAARYLRATTLNYTGAGAPTVNVGAAEDTVQFAELAAPAGNGAGAAVDTSALPGYKTIQVNGTFKGVANIEVSCDEGTTWATVASFQQKGGTWSGVTYGNRMRISRSGILAREANPGTFTCDVGASTVGGAGGGGGGGSSVSVVEGSLVGDGSAENPLGAHVFVWALGVDWVDIYAAMDAVPGPKICFVEADPNGGERLITPLAGEDPPPLNLNDIYFWGLSGALQGTLTYVSFETDWDREINVELATTEIQGMEVAFLHFRDIWVTVDNDISPMISPPAGGYLEVDIDGGALTHEGDFSIASGPTRVIARNHAVLQGGGGSPAMFTCTDDSSTLTLISGASTTQAPLFSGSNDLTVAVFLDASCHFRTGIFSGGIAHDVTLYNYAFDEGTNQLYRLEINAGAVVANAVG